MSFAISSVAMQGAGLASSVVGSYWSAKNSRTMLKGQARLADTNARIAELGAQQELIRGQQEVARITLQAGHLKSGQRAAMAANGIDLGEGNAAEIQASTDLMKELDTNTATANAVRSAWGYRTQAVNLQNQATVQRGTAAGVKPGMAAFGSLLGGAGQVAGSWYSLNKAGAFNSPSNG
ncbi:MAG: hypothetical protein DWQ11_18820 [Proteobacteria bacterium]|nr:MAG: hypothetical protein DWQ11_18820 [Pseudomonadota bacterium]